MDEIQKQIYDKTIKVHTVKEEEQDGQRVMTLQETQQQINPEVLQQGQEPVRNLLAPNEYCKWLMMQSVDTMSDEHRETQKMTDEEAAKLKKNNNKYYQKTRKKNFKKSLESMKKLSDLKDKLAEDASRRSAAEGQQQGNRHAPKLLSPMELVNQQREAINLSYEFQENYIKSTMRNLVQEDFDLTVARLRRYYQKARLYKQYVGDGSPLTAREKKKLFSKLKEKQEKLQKGLDELKRHKLYSQFKWEYITGEGHWERKDIKKSNFEYKAKKDNAHVNDPVVAEEEKNEQIVENLEGKKDVHVDVKNVLVEEDRRLQEEKEEEKRIADQKKVIAEGYKGIHSQKDDKVGEWAVGAYADMVHAFLEKEGRKLTGNDLKARLETLNQIILQNKTTMMSYIDDTQKEKTLGMPQLANEWQEKLAKDLGEKLLLSEEEFYQTMKEACDQSLPEGYEQAKRRQEVFKNEIPTVKDMEDFWKRPEIQGLILKETDEEKFNTTLKSLKEQSVINESMLNRRVDELVTRFSSDAVKELVKKKLGGYLVMGASGIIKAYTDMAISTLHLSAPEVYAQEQLYKKAFAESGIDPVYDKCVQENLFAGEFSGKKLEEAPLKAELKKMSDTIHANEKAAEELLKDKELTARMWKMIEDYSVGGILSDTPVFQSALEKLADERLVEANAKVYSRTDYLYGVQANEITFKKEDPDDYLARYVFDFEGFVTAKDEKLLDEGHRKLLRDALDAALAEENNVFAQKLPALKEIKSVEQLSLLAHNELVELMNMVRYNLSETVVTWRNIDCVGAEELKQQLSHRLVTGEYTAEQLRQIVEVHIQSRMQEEKAAEKRLEAQLFVGGLEQQSIDYQYMGVEGGKRGWISSAKFPVADRIERSAYAKEAWRLIEEAGLADEFTVLMMNLSNRCINGKKSNQDDRVARFATRLMKYKNIAKQDSAEGGKDAALEAYLKDTKNGMGEYGISDAILTRKTLDRLMEIFDQVSKHRWPAGQAPQFEEYITEMMLYGMQDDVFSTGGMGQDTFTTYDENEYILRVAKHSQILAARRSTIDNALGSIDKNLLPENERKEMKKRLYAILQGLQPYDGEQITEKMEHENMLRYGVRNVNELVGRLQMMYMPGKEQMRDDARKTAERFKHHTDKLRTYKNGLFAPMLKELIQNSTVWMNMTERDEEGFETYLTELEGQIGSCLSVLQSEKNRAATFVNHQFIVEYQDEILRALSDVKSRHDQKYWEDKVEEYGHNFMNYAPKGRSSIHERMNKVEDKTGTRKGWLKIYHAKDSTFPWMLEMLLHSDASAFSILFREKAMIDTLNRIKKNWFENMEILKANIPYMKVLDIPESKLGPEQFSQIALIKQYVTPKIALLEPEYVKEHYIEIWADIQKTFDEAREPEINREHLSKKAEVCTKIEKQKEEGRQAASEHQAERTKLRGLMENVGSPVLAVYGRKKGVEPSMVEKARKKMQKRLAGSEAPGIVLEIMAERSLSDQAYSEEEQQRDFEWLVEAHRLITEAVQNRHDKSAKDIIARLVYAFTWKPKSREEVPADKPTIDAIMQEYDNNKLVVDEIEGFRPKHPALQGEFEDFKDEMRMGLYVQKENCSHIRTKALRYFKTCEIAFTQIDRYLEQKKDELKLDDEKRAKYFLGLRDYLMKDIIRDCEKEQASNYSEAIEKTLADPLMRQYIYDSASVMQRVAYTDESAVEKMADGLYTRKSMEDVIADCKDEKLIGAYNALNLDQRKLFAMVLSLPGKMTSGEGMATEALVEAEQKAKTEVDVRLQQALVEYIDGGSFEAKIDYNMVMRRLVKIDKKTGNVRMSKTMFENALSYVATVDKKRTEAIPKDFERMGNAKVTMHYGGLFAGVRENREKQLSEAGLTNQQGFKDYLKQIEQTERGNIGFMDKFREGVNTKTLIERVDNLTESQMAKLVMILQDRTAIDFSSSTGFLGQIQGKVTDYANVEKRTELFDQLTAQTPESETKLRTSINVETYTNAMRSLFSYQLRDDVNLNGRSLRRDDFVSSSIKRKTKVDWELLRNALDLLAEIEQQNNKLIAVRQAKENIENSPNEKAKEEYLRLKEDTAMSKAGFEEFLKANAEKDKENEKFALPLIASYQKLSDNEKILFIRALENRDILDVSRENLYSSFFGLSDRDYCNPKERDDLINEYIEKTGGKKTTMSLSDGAFYEAMKSLLSTQVDDSRDFANEKDFKKLYAGEKWYEIFEYKTRRNTAIDWKLFARALQLVKRTTNENETVKTDRELYRSQGDLSKGGRFINDPDYLRKNLHSTGSRFNRFFSRRVMDEVGDAIPYSIVGKTLLLSALNTRNRNKLLNAGIMKKEDNDDEEDKVITYAGYAGYGGIGLNVIGGLADTTGGKVTEGLGAAVADATDMFAKICNIGGVLSDRNMVKNSADKAKQFEAGDEKRRQKAAEERQDEEQTKLSDQSIARNKFLQDLAAKVTVQAKNEEFVNGLCDIATGILDANMFGVVGLDKAMENLPFMNYVKATLTEVTQLINFFGRLLSDKKTMKQYYAEGGPFFDEIKAIRTEGLALAGIEDGEEKLKDYDDVELARRAYGFEGFDEQSAYVGLNLVHNILFTASDFNPNREMRFRAVAMMYALGMKNDIGKVDSKTGDKLYGKLMGQDYR